MRAKRLLTAAGVMAAGLFAALPFRQPSSPPRLRPPPVTAPLELTLRKPDVTLEASPPGDESPAVGLEAASGHLPSGKSPSDYQTRALKLESLAPPPQMPVSFQPRSESAVAPPMPTGAALTGPAPDKPAVKRDSRPRAYHLRDGDTLEKLAERYLGSRDRAIEIFEANREVLLKPDLLPVGTVITIPPRLSGAEKSTSPAD